jgi:hypothetical protein
LKAWQRLHREISTTATWRAARWSERGANSNDDERLPSWNCGYDRAQAFKDDLPYEEYRTWQPRKVVAVLAGIDPSIMKSSTLRIGRQDQPGVHSTNMKTMDTEFVLSAEDIKDHYDKLGGGLHIPTMAQFQDDKLPDPVAVRARCDEVVSVVDRVLSSRVWNSTFGVSSHIDCPAPGLEPGKTQVLQPKQKGLPPRRQSCT